MFGKKQVSKWRSIPVKYRAACLVLAVSLILSAIFTYLPRRHPGAVSWETIYRKAGLYGETSKLYSLPLCVTFLDVGQGDCTLIKAGKSFILIDSGNPGCDRRILQEMKKQGCRDLEYLIATHPHADHIGSFPELLPQIRVKRIILPKVDPNQLDDPALYELFLSAVQHSGAQIIQARSGSTYTLEEAQFQILGPVQTAESLNNDSVVIRLTFQNFSFLFTGDAEEEEEFDLLRSGMVLKSSVLKCGHHGSKSSSSEEFLKAVSPETAVISCGKDNDYGHPSPETLEKLNRLGAEILRTDQQETIVIGTQGQKIWYS